MTSDRTLVETVWTCGMLGHWRDELSRQITKSRGAERGVVAISQGYPPEIRYLASPELTQGQAQRVILMQPLGRGRLDWLNNTFYTSILNRPSGPPSRFTALPEAAAVRRLHPQGLSGAVATCFPGPTLAAAVACWASGLLRLPLPLPAAPGGTPCVCVPRISDCFDAAVQLVPVSAGAAPDPEVPVAAKDTAGHASSSAKAVARKMRFTETLPGSLGLATSTPQTPSGSVFLRPLSGPESAAAAGGPGGQPGLWDARRRCRRDAGGIVWPI